MGFNSLYIGASGMVTHSEGMQVVGNNIANVNTVGFKYADANFSNLLSESLLTDTSPTTGYSQSGMGATVADVQTVFTEGAFESSNEVTDLAISGKGFFKVKDEDNGEVFYTRAGNFRFDKNGALRDPNGNIVQGAGGDVKFAFDDEGFVAMDPKATTQTQVIVNLNASDATNTNTDNSTSASDPFFGLFNAYNGQASNAGLVKGDYDLASPVTLYDNNGALREATVYWDKVSAASGSTTGESYWEFLVAMKPSDDGSSLASTSGAGLLMLGTATFNSAGNITGMSAYSAQAGSGKDLSQWSLATLSPEGSPQYTAQFASGGSTTVSMNFGLTAASGASWTGTATTADLVGTSPANLASFSASKKADYATTSYDAASSTEFTYNDGYARGYLTTLDVETDGVISGNFSNGQSKDLAQLKLCSFKNEWGLKREGNNLYSATAASGAAREGTAGDPTTGLGQIMSGSVETSNVDLAREFVMMITFQRGFQSNSKIITTTDDILKNAIALKH